MTRQQILISKATSFLVLFGAAGAAANAAEERRAPRSRDLDTLGINKTDFDSIRF